MSIRHTIWRVGQRPEPLTTDRLDTEALLEDMIVAAPKIMTPVWIIIGQQEDTGHCSRIDLLALAPDGALTLIELKRARPPQEALAQTLGYASLAAFVASEDLKMASEK